MLNIAILGSTGSIGKQTLDIIRNNQENFKVSVLTAYSNYELLYQQAMEFKPDLIAIADVNQYKKLKDLLDDKTIILSGRKGITEAASYERSDLVVSAIVGIAGLEPTYQAIKSGKRIALANKEALVTAGNLIIREAEKVGCSIIPVDSEHSAIFQCLKDEKTYVNNIILTASGGPFRNKTISYINQATAKDALNHPNWSMGKKITIDSATLMNKGLEVIEARWLFDMPSDKIKVCIHPESIIHSMVEFVDGAVIAQLGIPDMRIPIQYALTYPTRAVTHLKKLNLAKIGTLNFEEPDYNKFPCLELAYSALNQGDSSCIVLNGANEIAVNYFLLGKIKFTEIYETVLKALESHNTVSVTTIDDVYQIDEWSRKISQEIIKRWI